MSKAIIPGIEPSDLLREDLTKEEIDKLIKIDAVMFHSVYSDYRSFVNAINIMRREVRSIVLRKVKPRLADYEKEE